MVELKIYDKINKKLERLILISLAESISNYQRRIIVLSGSRDHGKLAAKVVNNCILNLQNFINDPSVLYVSETFEENTQWYNRFIEFKKNLIKENIFKLKYIVYKNSNKVMGQTFNILVLDMLKSLTPDDIGKLIGVVKGGGIIVIMAPPMELWPNVKTTFHEHLVTPPYTIKDTRNRFLKRFIRKLIEHQGIYIYDIDNDDILKNPSDVDLNVSFPEFRLPKIPNTTVFDKKLYKLAATEDQINVLRVLEEFLKRREVYFVLTADRGRGKSAAIGIGLAGISKIYKDKKLNIGITSPSPENVKVLFEFLIKSLRYIKLDYEIDRSNRRIKVGRIYIEYKKPLELLNRNYDIVVVDEAAGINVNMLYKFVKRFKKIVFSTTTHGYEGAGRTFTVRFLEFLKREKENNVIEYKMKVPIRYSSDDPIEKWLFDALVLDAEPSKLNLEDLDSIRQKRYKYLIPDLDSWFEGEENKLKQFVGIYILAHYKNRPNDVAMIADAPHHDGRAVELENRKIVSAIQIAYEGGIPEKTIERMLKKYKPKGNVIPDVLTKHYRSKDFAKLKGIRIVRIATHPEVQRMGIGSFALRSMEEEFRNKGYDWIGAGFGATMNLVKFWQKNGYVIVHITPERNPVSGEYSVIAIKPLNRKAEEIIKKFSYEFRWKFINSVTDVFFDIEPELALQIMKSPYEFVPHFKPLLTRTQVKRLKAYYNTAMTYEAIADSIRQLFLYYFIYNKKDKPQLDEKSELVVFSKIFLAWSFRKVSKYFGIKLGEARKIIKKASKKVFSWMKEKGIVELEE